MLTVSIIDVPPLEPGVLQFAQEAISVNEDAGAVMLTVTRTGGSDGSASVDFTTVEGTAMAGEDFTTRAGTLSWADGETGVRTIMIDLLSDVLAEEPELFTVQLSNPIGSVPGLLVGEADIANVTLIDVPVLIPGQVQFAQDSLTVSEEDGTVAVVVQRVGGSDGDVSVLLATNDGTASGGLDYADTTQMLQWTDGDITPRTVPIGILSDLLLETAEVFTVTLNDPLPDAQILGTPDVLTVSITDVPPLRPGVIQMAQTELLLTESGGGFSLGVVRVGGSDGTISVNYAFSDGTAISGDDFTGTNGTLVFGDGNSETQFISGAVLTDELEEGNETFTVTLTGATPADALGDEALRDVVITIEDEFEAPPLPEPGQVQFAQNSVTVSEEDGSVEVVVQRVGGSDGSVSVLLDTNAGSASSGSDYTNTTQLLQWADGDISTRTVSIGILSDLILEDTEVFTVTLNDPQPNEQVLGSPELLMVLITDVPPPVVLQPGVVQFSNTQTTVNEDAGSVTLTILRSAGADGSARVDFTTVAGTAQPGEDFNTRSGTLSWADGESGIRTIMVDLLPDELEEGPESFTVQLSNPVGSVPGLLVGPADTTSVNLIDVPVEVPVIMAGQVSIVSSQITVSEIDDSAGVVVERSGGSQGALSVQYTTLDVSAVASEDYAATSGTLNWNDGEIGTRRIEIPIVSDGQAEPSETFRLVLSNAVSSLAEADNLLGASEAIITIEDSTQPGVIRFVETTVTVAESDGDAELRVIREGGSDGAVSVQYSVAGNSATAGDDFVAEAGELSWASGDSGERTIRIAVLEDNQFEENETFTVTLSDATPLGDEQLGNTQAVVTLTDSSEAGELVVSQSIVTVDEAIGEVIIDVERRAGSAGAVQLNVTAQDGSAFERTDYQLDTSVLVWESGEDGVRQIRLRIFDDDIDEIDEQFSLQLALGNSSDDNAPQVTLNQFSVQVRIQDNDLPEPEQADPTLAEAGGFRLRVLGGDNQIGNPGDEIEPIVIEVIDSGNNNVPVPNIQVRWRVIPEGSVEFLDGTGGTADAQGRVSFRVRVIERGFNTLIASVDTSGLAAGESSGLSSRMVRQNVAIAETEIAIIVRGGLVASAGLRPNQASTVDALEEACEVLGVIIEGGDNISPEQQDLFDTCTELRTQLDDPALGASVDRLAGEEFFAFDDSIIQINDIQVTNVYSRLNAIRSGREETWDVSGLQLQIYDQSIPGSVVNAAQNAISGGAASADSFADSRLGTFINGTLSYGEVDGNGRQRDGDIETSGLTVGLDYRLTNQIVFGAGVGVTKTSTNFTGNEGDSEVDAFNVTLFGTWYEPQEGYLDAVLDFGRNDYTSNRRVNLPGSVDQFATGSTDANVAALTIGVGRDFSVGGWEFGPYGRISVVRARVNGFSETIAERVDGFGSGLDYSGRTIRSSAFSIGGQVTRTINTSKAVFLPQFRMEFETETQRKKDPITASFQNDPSNTPFEIVGNERDRTHLNIGIGSSFVLRGGRSGYVFYETQAQNALVTQHWLKLGVRLEF
ncbi:MAG: Calx-beta domain-containing protein [Granulosicoccus sp.]